MYQQLSLLGKKIKAVWSKIFDGEASTELQKMLAENIKSTSDKETYTFAQLFSRIREWLDEASFDTGKSYEYTIKNKKWQEGFAVDNDYLEDVKADSMLSGDLQSKIKGMAVDFADHKDERINDLIIANGNAFDGTAMFSDTRPNIVDGDGLDNIVTGTGITLALIQADLKSAMTQLKGMKIKGKPVNKNAKPIVLIPTQLWSLMNELRTSQTIIIGGASQSNDLQNTFEIIENYDQETTNNDWYLVNGNSKMKPFIIQNREEPKMIEIDDQKKDVKFYNWKARYDAGYGNPLSIVKVNN